MTAYSINTESISTTPKVIKQYLHEESGCLHEIEDVKTFSSGFRVRYFTIMSEGYTPEPIRLKLVSDKVDLAEALELGTRVRVIFQVRGREWEGKFFNDLEAKAVEVLQDDSINPAKTESVRVFNDSGIDENVPF